MEKNKETTTELILNRKIKISKRRILSLKKIIKDKKRKNQREKKLNKNNQKLPKNIFISENNLNNNFETDLNKNNKEKKIKIGKFQIQKSNLEFDEKINYYIEYWKMFNENEYILAKIKENLYEINNMKGHLQELKKLEKK